MKLLVGLLGLPVLLCWPATASAEQRGASATATAHARDELANAIAQGKITRTPTPSPTATPTPIPTPTVQPTTAPTDPPMPTPTPTPALPVPAANADPLGGYVRPSTVDPSWLELALPQGRWDVRFDTPACVPLQPWTNVWLAPGVQPPLLVARGAARDGALCGVADWAWHTDVPCAQLEQDDCDFEADALYWESLGAAAAAQVTETPTPVPPSVAPTIAPVPLPNRPAQPPTPPPPAPQVRVVVQTVVVTAVPTDTPIPEPAATAAPVLVRTTASPTPSPASTRAPVPGLVRQGTPRPTPAVAGVQVAAAQPGSASPAPDRTGLVAAIAVSLMVAAGLVAVAATLIRRRRYAPS